MRARQKVSRAGVELIKSFEGLRTNAARLPDGRWTLGYGHTFSAREGARVTQEDADALLRFDLLPVVDSINNLILLPLNQNQFDALVSFCFNIGVENFAQSTVLKRINEGRFAEAALAMDSWRSAEFNGQTYVLAPLIRRRAAEKNLFLTPEDISHQAATLGRPVEDVVPPAVTVPEPGHINPYASAAQAVQRQVIDLHTRTETVAENLHQGIQAPVKAVEDTDASVAAAGMNIDFQATIARAEAEQQRLEDARRAETLRLEAERLEAQRQAEALAAVRAAETARLEQAKVEQARLEQERLEQWREAQARIEAERAEAARMDSLRAEAVRQEQIRLEQLRLEQERIEAERLDQVRIENERLESQRQEAQNLQAEQARPAPPIDDEAEQARKAEAAAALMRLYSPYGGGNLGRPLTAPVTKPVNEPQSVRVDNVISTPELARQPDLEFSNHSVISPSTAESAPFEISARAEPVAPEVMPQIVDFMPNGSAATMPAPVITAFNPYAKPVPSSTPVMTAASETVDLPHPAPVDQPAPSKAPLTADTGLHWRDQLQRPLPQDYQTPQASHNILSEPGQPFLRAGPSSNFQTAAYEDDNEAWMMNGDRIALSAEEDAQEGDTLWQMIMKTLWLITISGIGLGCLGAATGAWWQATHDQTVIRNGMVDTYTFISISTAALGILFVSISVWLIMKRLGGLKD